MLGGRGSGNHSGGGVAAKPVDGPPPSYRVPGASVASRAAAASGAGSWADAARRANVGGAVTPPLNDDDSGHIASDRARGSGPPIDADGFRTVTKRGARGVSQAASTGNEGGNQDAGTGSKGDGVDASAASEGPRVDGDGEGQPTTADLLQAWHDEVAVVRRLRQQGLQSEHPAMAAACAARDAAEKAWRSSKEPAPTSVRLGRAQSKLDRAVAIQAEARQAMLDAERAHRVHMEGLQAILDESTERVRVRRSQLREVQEEVAADGTVGGTSATHQQAMQRVHSTICGEVGPTIAALVEQLDSSTPAWAALNGLLGKLSNPKEILENACGGAPSAQAYDIGDGADQWEGCSEWSESHEVGGGPGDGADAQPRGGQRDGAWGTRGDDQDNHDQDQDQPMGTNDWWDGPTRRWSSGARWQACGHGHWSRASWADQMEEGGDDDAGDGDLQPAPARRRLEPADAGAETRGAQRQQQQAQQPQQPPATDTDDGERKRRHEARVNQIVAMAIEAGVTPLTADGEELQLLDPHRLDAWVAERLPAALLC